MKSNTKLSMNKTILSLIWRENSTNHSVKSYRRREVRCKSLTDRCKSQRQRRLGKPKKNVMFERFYYGKQLPPLRQWPPTNAVRQLVQQCYQEKWSRHVINGRLTYTLRYWFFSPAYGTKWWLAPTFRWAVYISLCRLFTVCNVTGLLQGKWKLVTGFFVFSGFVTSIIKWSYFVKKKFFFKLNRKALHKPGVVERREECSNVFINLL